MRGILIVIVLCAVAAVVWQPAAAHAQIAMGDKLLTVNGGYVAGTGAVTEQRVDGGAVMFTYERLDWSKPVSLGFSIGYSEVSGDSEEGSEWVETKISSIPLYMGAKYWLGKDRFQLYAGAALGVYFSSVKRQAAESGETYASISTTGFGMGVPIGGTASISESMFINVNYTLNWLWDNEALKGDILHSVNLGLGFKLGS